MRKFLWKACVQHVGEVWASCGQKSGLSHSPLLSPKTMWENNRFIQQLYTFCMHNCTAIVGNFTSVISRLYPQYTGPIITTTNKINRSIV